MSDQPLTEQDMRDALDALNTKIDQARTIKNNSSGADDLKMTHCLDMLRTARTAIYDYVFLTSINDQSFTDAVNLIAGEAKTLDDVAGNLPSATEFINNLAGFLGTVGKVLPVLKAHTG